MKSETYMSEEEALLEQWRELTPEKKQKVLEFVENLKSESDNEKDFFALAGLWENRNITTESLRQEAWRENIQ